MRILILQSMCSSQALAYRILMFHPLQRLLESAQAPLELSCLNRFENLAELRAWLQTESNQVVSSYKWLRNDRFISEFIALSDEKLVIVEHPMAALAINPVQLK